ncbi:hypothetical protein [Novosphingobium naphthalenivorans]|uniref:hypothetical protein n=1 Tax=Novosphingobium naphthalenivorans TaxID=273168 RepID=UPI00083243C6|nr:hypothetical protein [Novosphingobium naphthalenivorans]
MQPTIKLGELIAVLKALEAKAGAATPVVVEDYYEGTLLALDCEMISVEQKDGVNDGRSFVLIEPFQLFDAG